MEIHHWEYDNIMRWFICTPPPVTAWSGITCHGCGTKITNELLQTQKFSNPLHAVLDILANQQGSA